MEEKKNPLVFTLVVWVIWLVITLAGQRLQAGETELDQLASNSIVFSVIAAVVFLLIVVAYKKWWYAVGFTGINNSHNLRLLALPVIFILIMVVLAFSSGTAMNVMLIILVNSLFVGISEELMMRGVLFHGVNFSQNLVRTVIITAVLFGSMHALNGFLTGNFAGAIQQAVLATGFGLWIGALRARLWSIIPMMILHGLWDFSVFTMGVGGLAIGNILTLVFAVILFIYGIWLLRGVTESVEGISVVSDA